MCHTQWSHQVCHTTEKSHHGMHLTAGADCLMRGAKAIEEVDIEAGVQGSSSVQGSSMKCHRVQGHRAQQAHMRQSLVRGGVMFC